MVILLYVFSGIYDLDTLVQPYSHENYSAVYLTIKGTIMNFIINSIEDYKMRNYYFHVGIQNYLYKT